MSEVTLGIINRDILFYVNIGIVLLPFRYNVIAKWKEIA